MKGKDGERECRAMGGAMHGVSRKAVMREAHGEHPDNEVDDALKRGGRIHKRRGGGVKSDYTEERSDPEEGGEEKKKGGRVHRKKGGKIEGMAMKPHMGRAGRRRGGKAGADLHPMTHDAGKGPHGVHTMPESEKVP